MEEGKKMLLLFPSFLLRFISSLRFSVGSGYGFFGGGILFFLPNPSDVKVGSMSDEVGAIRKKCPLLSADW